MSDVQSQSMIAGTTLPAGMPIATAQGSSTVFHAVHNPLSGKTPDQILKQVWSGEIKITLMQGKKNFGSRRTDGQLRYIGKIAESALSSFWKVEDTPYEIVSFNERHGEITIMIK